MIKLVRITTVPISLRLLLTDQMRYMKDKGFDVTMISADGPNTSSLVENEKCPHIIIPFTRQITPIKDLICIFKLLRILSYIKPDIVHTHTPKAGLIGMLASKILRVPLRIHTVAGLPFMTASKPKKLLLVLIEKLTYWASHYVLPNSYSMQDAIKTHKLVKNNKLDIIGEGSSNGIDLVRYNTENLSPLIMNQIKATIVYDKDCIYLIAVGRVVKDKGIIELIDSFNILNKAFKNLKLIILGPIENERDDELLPDHIMASLQKGENIIHINWTENVEYFMALSDVLVHASYREGLPNVLLQAGAMGCPIVCSDIPGNIDIVKHKKTGLLFKVGDTKAIVRNLTFALNNKRELANYAEALTAEIKIKFSRESVHNKIYHFYKSKLDLA